MIEKENENEKYYAIFKVIAISLIYFIIGIFIIFMVGVSKVNAATWSGVYDKSNVNNSANGNNNGTSTYAFFGTNAGIGVPVPIPSSYIFKDNLNQLGLGVIQTGDFKSGTTYQFEVTFKAQVGSWGPSASNWAMGANTLLGNMAGTSQSITNRTWAISNMRSTTRKVFGYTINVSEAKYTYTGQFVASQNNSRITFMFPNNTSSNIYNGIWYLDINININSLNTDKTNGDIINNQNNNTNIIINNQNQNTQELIDAWDRTWYDCKIENGQEVCKHRSDVIVEWEEENNNILKDIIGGLTSSDTDNPNSDLEDMGDSLASDSAISDLLLLPVTLYQNVLNNINGTCSPFNLGNLLGTDLTMPCINISTFLGNALYGTIDVLMSGFFILGIRKKFVDIFESLTSLRTGGNELE